MSFRKLLLPLAAAFFLTSCSTLSVNYDFNEQVDFNSYKTYDWLPLPDSARDNELNRQRFVNAVNNNLSGKGFALDAARADFKIASHFGKSREIQVTDWGYSYAPVTYYRGRGYLHPAAPTYATGMSVSHSPRVSVYEYEKGTLILDFIDTESNTLIWRATAKAVINPSSSPQEQTERINNAVEEILENFPPKK